MVSFLLWFWYQGDGGLIEWVWAHSFLCNFCTSFRRIGVNSSLKCVIKFICGAIWSWTLVGSFFISVQFHYLGLICLYFLSFWFSLGRFYLSKNVSISSRLSILLVYSCLKKSLMILSISVVLATTYPFSFLFFLWALSLVSLISLVKGLSILFIFSKNQLLVSLVLSTAFFVSISFISALIFMISFLLTLGLVCSSFSSCFWYKVRLFYWDFSLLLEVRLHWCKPPSGSLLLHPTDFGSSCFHLHLSPGIFWFPLWFLWWSTGCLVTLFSLHMFGFFTIFFL